MNKKVRILSDKRFNPIVNLLMLGRLACLMQSLICKDDDYYDDAFPALQSMCYYWDI